MEAPVAWVLNLDADLELAAPTRYASTRTIRTAMAAMVSRVAPLLVGPGDLLLDEAPARGSARGFRGQAFCPTPRAVALLERAGAIVEAHPSLDVLRRVNGRAFAAGLGPGLPHAAFVTDRSAAAAMLASAPGSFAAWRVKRQHGMAGRGQIVVEPARRSPSDDRFVEAGLAEGGVQIEPNVSIVAEYAKHGVIAPAKRLRLGALVRQRCDARGVWLESRAVRAPSEDERAIDERLTVRAVEVAGALVAAGYFGPFGIDAFTYRDEHGAIALHSLGEINARYSMGFGIGLPLGT